MDNIDLLVDQLIAKEQPTIVLISTDKLHPFPAHPFKVQDNEEMEALVESILSGGILTPLIVRPMEGKENEYEVISGHRRLHAAIKAGMETVPAFITPMSRDAAAIALVDSNLHREHILPSEKAFAYKMKLEALKRQGKRTDLTCGQVGHKSRDTLSEEESGRQAQRYIRLTQLIPELLQKVDEGRISLSPGVELSYLGEDAQRLILEAMELENCTPSFSQAVRMRRLYREGQYPGRSLTPLWQNQRRTRRNKSVFPRNACKGCCLKA